MIFHPKAHRPRKTINFCLKKTKWTNHVPPNDQHHIYWPFWSILYLLDHFTTLKRTPYLGIFGKNRAISGPTPSQERLTPNLKKMGFYQVSYVRPIRETPNVPVWCINVAAIFERCQNEAKISLKMAIFCHFLL